MKILKPFLLSVCLSVSMGSFSTVALAECEDGRTCFEPDVAIDNVINKIMEARHAINNGADSQGIINLIKEAKRLNKEIKQSVLQPADTHLLEAENRSEALHGML